MGIVYAVSGIDTNVGKTIVTGLVARTLMRAGKSVITAKLVQTGNVGFSEDLQEHRRLMGNEGAPTHFSEDAEGLTAPQIFAFPASPHLAANLEGRTLELSRIVQAVNTLATRYDIVLVECAGGLAVPLTEDVLTADFIAQNAWNLLLVTSGILGSLSHTLLSLEAAQTRNIPLCGVLYNAYPASDPVISKDTPRMICRYLEKYGYAPNVVHIPALQKSGKSQELNRDELQMKDLSPIFGA